jgi:hypothetical protein
MSEMIKRTNTAAVFAAALALAGFAPPVFAYLDPSTGSMILSAIVGVFATVGLAVKTYWYKLKSLFRGKADDARDDDMADDHRQPQDSANQ